MVHYWYTIGTHNTGTLPSIGTVVQRGGGTEAGESSSWGRSGGVEGGGKEGKSGAVAVLTGPGEEESRERGAGKE